MINERESREVVVLAFRAAKLTEQVIVKAIQAYLNSRGDEPVHHGKMKLKDLMQLDQGAKMMEMKADAIGGFKRIAGKYNIDFAIAKDKSKEPPLFQVFFKARDEDVITKAFNEYVAKRTKKAEKQPFKKTLEKLQEKADILNKANIAKDKHRTMEKAL
ncbi:MAG: PcfB family protein [Lachnospiraceae bacterium]|nr:PcfB family protein [Lachnospiraceae bacterium]